MNDEAPGQPQFVWPDVARMCFGPGSPPKLNACVGWVQSKPDLMTGYVEGYRRAATALYEWVVATGTSPDYLVFPLAFLWRHQVELALKEIIAVGRVIDGKEGDFPPNHRLKKLWTEARPHIEKCGPAHAPELANVEANIYEFESIDPGADGFRYPQGKDQHGRSMPNAPDLVNLRVLHEGMTAIANFLEAVRCELSLRRQHGLEREWFEQQESSGVPEE